MKKIISSTLVLLGFILGATALSVMADWAAPGTGCTPPACNPDAPINVGSSLQTKLGALWIKSGLAVDGNLVISTSTPAIGKVLTALDSQGTVGWQTPASSGADSAAFCNTMDTGTSVNVQTLSLMKNGKNICSDAEGCTFHASDTNGTVMNVPAATSYVQMSSGLWRNSENLTGTNGDTTASSLTNFINSVAIYDDVTPTTALPFGAGAVGITETSPNTVTVARYQSIGGYTAKVSVCDF